MRTPPRRADLFPELLSCEDFAALPGRSGGARRRWLVVALALLGLLALWLAA